MTTVLFAVIHQYECIYIMSKIRNTATHRFREECNNLIVSTVILVTLMIQSSFQQMSRKTQTTSTCSVKGLVNFRGRCLRNTPIADKQHLKKNHEMKIHPGSPFSPRSIHPDTNNIGFDVADLKC